MLKLLRFNKLVKNSMSEEKYVLTRERGLPDGQCATLYECLMRENDRNIESNIS